MATRNELIIFFNHQPKGTELTIGPYAWVCYRQTTPGLMEWARKDEPHERRTSAALADLALELGWKPPAGNPPEKKKRGPSPLKGKKLGPRAPKAPPLNPIEAAVQQLTQGRLALEAQNERRREQINALRREREATDREIKLIDEALNKLGVSLDPPAAPTETAEPTPTPEED